MNRKNRSTEKKFRAAALLLLVYALFLSQKILLNQVLCFKPDGSADVELAFLSFICDCKDEDHDHIHHGEEKNESRYCSETGCCITSGCCFDQPIEDSLLRRDKTAASPYPALSKVRSVQGEEKITLPNPCVSFLDLIPLSKFLEQVPFLKGKTIMLC
ncbi:MAG: hypothetical protein KAW12_08780 [Candidatus Aminicenantes bacterium]|nr:hypothetical protein [Candidatus Aminicenantes bacterium]